MLRWVTVYINTPEHSMRRTRTQHSTISMFTLVILLISSQVYANKPSPSCQYDPKWVNTTTQTLITQHHLDAKQAQHLLNYYPCNPQIIELITRPHEGLPWPLYRRHFITEDKISKSIAFKKQYSTTLQDVERQYGVPANIIVAIIGVESHFGHNLGPFPALQALSTLAFAYPKRHTFFNNELITLIAFGQTQHTDITRIMSSYAGALGIPQFMPSALMHYCISYHHAKPCDLNTFQDSIASIAHYLKQNGWHPQQPVVQPLPLPPNSYTVPLQHNYALLRTQPDTAHPNPRLSSGLLTMESAHGRSHWLVYPNFDVIMRYNISPLYAMAVAQLAQAIG